jgi:eukaryotic-like serine/threonine-protein kinase
MSGASARLSGALCPRCAVAIPSDAPYGLCPLCVTASSLAPPAPTRIGDYTIERKLGAGGSGSVYLARRIGAPLVPVALKWMRAGAFDSEHAVTLFLAEVENHARLRHPGIVQIYDTYGEDSGAPYFVMQYVEAGALADTAQRAHFGEPRRAALLVASVARAVHYAHEAGVLHLDLKPANILLDAAHRPYVSDFSLARYVHAVDHGPLGGTIGTMAPEQLRGDPALLSTACDVFGLGATLYELWTGRPPYDGADFAALAQAFTAPVTPPERLVPGVSRELSRVCLGALAIDPTRRYRSAAALADELERALAGEAVAPPHDPRTPLARRALLWARRHPLLALAASITLGLMLTLDVLSLEAVRQEEAELVEATLRANTALADASARELLWQMRDDAARVAELGLGEASRALFVPGDLPRREASLAGMLGDFSSIYAVGADGRVRARQPAASSAAYSALDFSARDYMRGGLALGAAGEVYVSRAFHASALAGGRVKYAYATPVRATDGELLGLLVATRHADASFERLKLGGRVGNEQWVTLLAPAEHGDGGAQVARYYVLAHSGLVDGQRTLIASSMASRLAQRFAHEPARALAEPSSAPIVATDYHDPVSGFEGTWYTAFAGVGNTGYVVAVQSAPERALGPARRFARALATYAGVMHLLLLAVIGLAVAASITRVRRR